MQDDQGVDSPQTTRPRGKDADVSALTGLGMIAIIASLVLSRLSPGSVGATVVGFVALVPFGAALVTAGRRRAVRAMLLPLVMFVLTAVVSVLRVT